MYYFSDYTINIHKKSHKNILISYIGHVTLNYVKSLDLFINNANEYTEESNGNKYLMQVPTDESKDKLKENEKILRKIKNLINNDSDDFDKKYMKIKFSSDDDLPLKKTLEFYYIIIIIKIAKWRQQILSTSSLRWLFVQVSWSRYW